MNIYRVAQIRQVEQLAYKTEGLNEAMLMGRAGEAAYQCLNAKFPDAKTVAVVCGKGNNGGDGYVLALLAHQAGKQVTIYHLDDIDALPPVAKSYAQQCQQANIQRVAFSEDIINSAELIVDAVLGIGVEGKVRGLAARAIGAINHHPAPVLALDVPSGLQADRACALGHCVKAQVTVTFIANKLGLVTGEGCQYTGELVVDDLGLAALLAPLPVAAQGLTSSLLHQALLPRARHAHKGDFGHVLVVGGDYGMAGAVRMAAHAAYRVGAGLVSVATRMEHTGGINDVCPEIMTHGVHSMDGLLPLLARASVIVVGPGLGEDSWGNALFHQVLAMPVPLVVDASALPLLAKTPCCRQDWVLTPHPGEAASLLKETTQTIQSDRYTAVRRLQNYYAGTVVLKGAGTLVHAERGESSVCVAGNPGMASGGMGDVLSGVIAGLIAQGLAPPLAARVGVLVHASAGDLAAKAGGERGLMATDLLPYLRQCVNP